MGRTWEDIGAVPNEEKCVDFSNNLDLARLESKIYMHQLMRAFPIPEGVDAKFAVKLNPHDFGSYPSVILYFDETQEGWDYFREVECGQDFWDEESKRELRLLGDEYTKALQKC